MPPHHARPATTRWGLALLCLLAAFAYLTRDPAPATCGMPGMMMAGGHMHGDAPTSPHEHGAHCPFCFTAAFALTPPDATAPRRADGRAAGSPEARALGRPASALHVQARGPPPLG